MSLVPFGVVVLLGFVFGYFLALPVLVVLTAISVIIAIYMIVTYEELEKLLGLLFLSGAIITNLVMWGTYYYASGQTWIGVLFHRYVIR